MSIEGTITVASARDKPIQSDLVPQLHPTLQRMAHSA